MYGFEIKRPRPVPPRRTVQSVLATLVRAFDGAIIEGQTRALTSTDRLTVEAAAADAQVPILCWQTGRLAAADWDRWTQNVKIDVPARLRIHVEWDRLGQEQIWQTLDALFIRAAVVKGLPVDLDGTVVPYSVETARLYDDEALFEMIDRGGPVLTSLSVRDQGGFPYAMIDLVAHVEFNVDLDYRKFPAVKVVQVGIIPNDAQSQQWEPGQLSDVSDQAARGAFNTPDPVFTEQGSHVERGFPPLPPEGTVHVEGADPAGVLVSIVVVPSTLALAVAATSALEAVQQFLDGSALALDGGATWATTNAGVATVSGVGVVTGVAPGSASISCSFLGVTSNVCAVTVS